MADDVRQLFEGLEARFQPAKAQGLEAVVQFVVTGPDGGEWYAEVHDGSCTVREGRAPAPTVTLTARDRDLVRLVQGDLDPRLAFLTGKIKVKGDLQIALRVREAFGW